MADMGGGAGPRKPTTAASFTPHNAEVHYTAIPNCVSLSSLTLRESKIVACNWESQAEDWEMKLAEDTHLCDHWLTQEPLKDRGGRTPV